MCSKSKSPHWTTCALLHSRWVHQEQAHHKVRRKMINPPMIVTPKRITRHVKRSSCIVPVPELYFFQASICNNAHRTSLVAPSQRLFAREPANRVSVTAAACYRRLVSRGCRSNHALDHRCLYRGPVRSGRCWIRKPNLSSGML